jgi:UDP-N-acetylglucosamine transferase subunit ALG13
MQYSRKKNWLPIKLLLQFPKLLYRVYAERRWLKNVVHLYKIAAVISDNRLGLSHKKIPTVYITHQLHIKTGNRFTESIAQKIHYHFINKYSACWVPDAAGEINLAGELAHPAIIPKIPVTYLGPLSRFKKTETEIKYDLCVLLSGPEPQRSIFEKIVLNDLKKFEGNAFVVLGLPGELQILKLKSGLLEIQNHLPAAELSLLIQQSKTIICRSGYSSVMDLVKLQKHAILVPTSGQTEQEYLASYLQDQHLFYAVQQKDFSLPDALERFNAFNFSKIPLQQNDYEKVIENFVQQLLNQ